VQRNILTVPVRRVSDASTTTEQDLVAVEEPLEIRLGGRNVAITMRTPGNDQELAAGFLKTEGILEHADQISHIATPEPNVIDIVLTNGAGVDLERLERHFYMSSSCGVCGKASIGAIEAAGCPILIRDRPAIDAALLHGLPQAVRSKQAVFERTGGLHAAALFDSSGDLLSLREDVGRHNALDKLIGAAFLAGSLPLSDHILVVSGRVSFELVQKAVMAGIAVIAAVGAPSSLAVEVALRFGVTLAGFVREGRFNIYSGEWRLRQ
jgi:FdhD protein